MTGVIRAKMKCVTVLKFENGATVQLVAVRDDANKVDKRWTLAGKAELTINDIDAMDRFEPGKEYFVDFDDVPEK